MNLSSTLLILSALLLLIGRNYVRAGRSQNQLPRGYFAVSSGFLAAGGSTFFSSIICFLFRL